MNGCMDQRFNVDCEKKQEKDENALLVTVLFVSF